MLSNSKSTKATLKSVAEQAGVSRAAVSFVLNGRDAELRIAPETKERILEAARLLNYTPNHFARTLNGKSTRTIGVLWSFSGPHRADNVIRQFTRKALAANYVTHLFDSMSDAPLVLKVLTELSNRQADGIILQAIDSTILDHPGIRDLLKTFRATVVVGQSPVPVWPDQVTMDRDGAFRRAVDHFLAKGRRHLGVLASNAGSQGKVATIGKYWAERGQALENFSAIHPDAECVGDRADQVNAALAAIDWKGSRAPDALICSSDEYAFISIAWLRQHGLRVPEDVAVVGANDSEMAPYFTPPLASVKRCDDEAADQAMEFLFGRLKNPELPPQTACIDIPFVCRASAG